MRCGTGHQDREFIGIEWQVCARGGRRAPGGTRRCLGLHVQGGLSLLLRGLQRVFGGGPGQDRVDGIVPGMSASGLASSV